MKGKKIKKIDIKRKRVEDWKRELGVKGGGGIKKFTRRKPRKYISRAKEMRS